MLQELVKQHLSSFIITGAVAAVSAYVLWGGDNRAWKQGALRPSLENLGNTCFLNCVTQALSSVEEFYRWLQAILLIHVKDATTEELTEIPPEIRKTAPMISALYDVLSTLKIPTDGSQSTSLSKIHSAMSEHGWDSLFTQEDAYEAFQVLITSIEKEAKMLIPQTTHKLFHAPVQGKFLISLECMECRTESSKKIEPFDNITLHLSKNHNISLMNMSFNSLRDMLTSYFASEKVSGVECENCSEIKGCPMKCDFIKYVKIAKAPKCLCIQINRTEWNNGVMTKNNQHVSFPVNSLDLTLFAYKALLFQNEDEIIEQQPATSRPVEGYEVVRTYDIKNKDLPMLEGLVYSLKSVIVHYGTANAGHYATYRRLDNNSWLYASDDVVRAVLPNEVERQQVYLLFYERQTIPEILTQGAIPSTPPTTPVEVMTPPVMVGDTDSAPHSPPVMVQDNESVMVTSIESLPVMVQDNESVMVTSTESLPVMVSKTECIQSDVESSI